MARLVGVDLPRDKRIEVALTYIYGIGRTRAQQLLAETGVDPDTRTNARTRKGPKRTVAGKKKAK
jgi:small subunit ribosomal protein S13